MRKRLLVAALTAATVLTAAPAAQAACAVRTSFIERYQARDAAITLALLKTDVVAPELPFSRVIIGGQPRGPLVRFSYVVKRVYKGGDAALHTGAVLTRTERVRSLAGQDPPGTRYGVYPTRTASGWQLPATYYLECSPGVWMTAGDLRKVALLNRYAQGRDATAFGCTWESTACWSIKRGPRGILLRTASFLPGAGYRLCVRAPNRLRTCRRFPFKSDASGLQSSRVRWASRSPNKGRGVYTVTWELPGVESFDASPRSYRDDPRYLPRLTFGF